MSARMTFTRSDKKVVNTAAATATSVTGSKEAKKSFTCPTPGPNAYDWPRVAEGSVRVNALLSDTGYPAAPSARGGEDARAVVGDRDGVLDVSGPAAVGTAQRPAVGVDRVVVGAPGE